MHLSEPLGSDCDIPSLRRRSQGGRTLRLFAIARSPRASPTSLNQEKAYFVVRERLKKS